MDYTIQYYNYWLSNVAHHFFPVERVYALASQLEAGKAADREWLMAAVKHTLRARHSQPQASLEANKLGRELGRSGEQLVYNLLKERGWTISHLTNQDLYPKFGSSPTDFDMKARWGDSAERLIEVKTLSENAPFVYVYYKQKIKIDLRLSKRMNHFHVFVRGNDVFYVRTSEIKYSGFVRNINTPTQNCFWVVDPQCLRVLK